MGVRSLRVHDLRATPNKLNNSNVILTNLEVTKVNNTS